MKQFRFEVVGLLLSTARPLKKLGLQASRKHMRVWETTAPYLLKKMNTQDQFDVLCNQKEGRLST